MSGIFEVTLRPSERKVPRRPLIPMLTEILKSTPKLPPQPTVCLCRTFSLSLKHQHTQTILSHLNREAIKSFSFSSRIFSVVRDTVVGFNHADKDSRSRGLVTASYS